ncbi:palmitoyltransferase, partial [Ceratobasidium sp. UAMH 11750]
MSSSLNHPALMGPPLKAVLSALPAQPPHITSSIPPPQSSTHQPNMRLFSLTILQVNSGKASSLITASDLSTFSFYQKGSVAEFMAFFSGAVAERTPAGQRQSIQEKSYTFHVYNRGGAENLVGVLISDEEYP